MGLLVVCPPYLSLCHLLTRHSILAQSLHIMQTYNDYNGLNTLLYIGSRRRSSRLRLSRFVGKPTVLRRDPLPSPLLRFLYRLLPFVLFTWSVLSAFLGLLLCKMKRFTYFCSNFRSEPLYGSSCLRNLLTSINNNGVDC